MIKYWSVITVYLSILNLSAQVDQVKMRHEVTSHQFKPQTLGEITQIATIIDSNDMSRPNMSKFQDILVHQAELYHTPNKIHYRGQEITSNDILINQVFVGSSPFSPYYLLPTLFDDASISRAEILYGSNLSAPHSQNSATVAFNLYQSELKNDSKTQVRPNIIYSNGGWISSVGIDILKSNQWSNNLYISYHSPSNYATSDSVYSFSSKHQLHFQNTFQKRINHHHKIQFHFTGNYQTSYLVPKLIIDSIYKLPSSIFPSTTILSYFQWIKSSDASIWHDQITTSLSAIHTRTGDTTMYSTQPYSTMYQSTRLSLQSNGFKSIGSRHLYTYGGHIFYESLSSSSSSGNTQTPIFQSKLYFKKEIRLSSDISWIFGGSVGWLYIDLVKSNPSSNSSSTRYHSPIAAIQASWTRHICENSNYTINLFLNYTPPLLQQITPIRFPLYFQSNHRLNSEKNLILEGNLYRKFWDKFEWNLSVFGSFHRDAILARDYFLSDSNPMVIYGQSYQRLQYQNIPFIIKYGIDNELKLHISPRILAYGSFHFLQTFFEKNNATFDYIQSPFYGHVGVKYKLGKLYMQLWGNYQISSYLPSHPTRYNIDFGKFQNDYATLHIATHYQIHSQIQISFSLNNMLNQQAFTYGATLPNIGRNLEFQIRTRF